MFQHLIPHIVKTLFKLADYSKVNLTAAELNHVFFVTPTITNFQSIQSNEAKLTKAMSSTKKITYGGPVLSKKISQIPEKNTFVDSLITQVKSNSNPHKVYELALYRKGGSGHAVGIWKTDEGAYHFLDANIGWFRCKDENEFREWFKGYFSSMGYDKLFQYYQINSFYKTSDIFTETIKDWFIYKAAIAIKQALSSWLFPEKPSMEQDNLSAKPEAHSLAVRALALDNSKQPQADGELRPVSSRLDIGGLLDSQITPKHIAEKQAKGGDFSRPIFHKPSDKLTPAEKNEEQIEPPNNPKPPL